jgi:small subunit ribosomal protein S17
MSDQQPDGASLLGHREGIVTSDKRDKTIKVVIGRQVRFPKYGKIVRRRTFLHAHDERNEARLGDRVRLAPCRPISKTKRWRLVGVLEKAAT